MQTSMSLKYESTPALRSMLQGFEISRSFLSFKRTADGFGVSKKFPSRRFGNGPNPSRIAEAPAEQKSTFLVENGSARNPQTSGKEVRNLSKSIFPVLCYLASVGSIVDFSVMPTIP